MIQYDPLNNIFMPNPNPEMEVDTWTTLSEGNETARQALLAMQQYFAISVQESGGNEASHLILPTSVIAYDPISPKFMGQFRNRVRGPQELFMAKQRGSLMPNIVIDGEKPSVIRLQEGILQDEPLSKRRSFATIMKEILGEQGTNELDGTEIGVSNNLPRIEAISMAPSEVRRWILTIRQAVKEHGLVQIVRTGENR